MTKQTNEKEQGKIVLILNDLTSKVDKLVSVAEKHEQRLLKLEQFPAQETPIPSEEESNRLDAIEQNLIQIQKKESEQDIKIEESAEIGRQKFAQLFQSDLALIAQALVDLETANNPNLIDLKEILEKWGEARQQYGVTEFIDVCRELLETTRNNSIEIQTDARRLRKILENVGVNVEQLLRPQQS